MSDALITAITTLLIAGGAGLRWWIERRDAQRKAKSERKTRELSETEAAKTIRTLERQLRQERRTSDALRRELSETAIALADREQERLREGRRR